MKCAVHSDVDATGYCRNCGKPMCPDCVRPVRDVLYCEDCLASGMGHAAPASPPPQASQAGYPPQAPAPALPPPAPAGIGPSPALAFLLGFLPGLGAFYNEQYGKGMIHLAIFLVLFIAGVNGAMSGGAEAALWICISALWIYMPIDAMRTAQAKRAGQTLSDPLDNFSKGRPIGPILLIGAGLLLLLNNFDWFPWYRISQFFFPAILIGVGILMFRNRMNRGQ
ncbi:MAG TPA: B-box zinc finger protein [Candidatus Solibacter sp.]|nr:B-box zinc finger protein [Candidatus Solibacter sp.]